MALLFCENKKKERLLPILHCWWKRWKSLLSPLLIYHQVKSFLWYYPLTPMMACFDIFDMMMSIGWNSQILPKLGLFLSESAISQTNPSHFSFTMNLLRNKTSSLNLQILLKMEPHGSAKLRLTICEMDWITKRKQRKGQIRVGAKSVHPPFSLHSGSRKGNIHYSKRVSCVHRWGGNWLQKPGSESRGARQPYEALDFDWLSQTWW